MSKLVLQKGQVPNDGTGDSLRVTADKINDNFNEIYLKLGDGTNLTTDEVTLNAEAQTLTNKSIDGATNTLTQIPNSALVNTSMTFGTTQVTLGTTTTEIVGLTTVTATNVNGSNIVGDLSGDVVGDVTGNVTGDVVGDVTGDLTGNVLGNVTGNLLGNVTGDIVGNITGYQTGDMTGSVFADDSTVLVDAVGGYIPGTVVQPNVETITATSGTVTYNISSASQVVIVNIDAESADLVLPNGVNVGDTKVIICSQTTGAENFTLTEVSNSNLTIVGGTTVTADADAESVAIVWTGSKWVTTSVTATVGGV